MLTADYAKGHSLVLSSSMANDTHIPGLIRGHEGTILMVPDGKFEGKVDFITVTPQGIAKPAFKDKHGTIEMKIETEPRETHMENFLRCVRTRQTPVLDADTAYRAMVPIAIGAVVSRGTRALFRRGRGEGRGHATEGVTLRHSARTAVILIDTRRFGISTPSLATARAGGSVGKNFAYASFRPGKSSGRASRTRTSTTSSSFAPAARRMLSQLTSAWRVCSWIVAPAS
jgi:hypothetical protein